MGALCFLLAGPNVANLQPWFMQGLAGNISSILLIGGAQIRERERDIYIYIYTMG